MRKKIAIKTALCIAIAGALSGCAGAGKRAETENGGKAAAEAEAAGANSGIPEFVFTYAENQAEDYPTTQGAYKFAELINEKTNGRIQIRVQANGVLGDEKSVCEQLQFGGVDFTRVSLTALAEFVPKLSVLQLPYLYRDADHMWAVLNGEIGEEFMDSLDGSDLVALSWYDAGARNFYNSVRPIEKPEDLKGLKIRVQESEMMKGMIKYLEAVPTPMAYGEVYSALQTGAIDGAENNWPSYESAGHYEVAGYITIDEHSRIPELQLVSRHTWDKLSEEDQAMIRECAKESAEYEKALWAEREKASEEIVRSSGCEITELTPEEKERFREAVKPMYEEYCGGDMDIVEAVIEAGK
ncbi:DctP family TRAP transporter solute-binding subunit [Clostridium sp. MCC353]|uniref:TRAP transporter substrate-binding protein n=1 Tax=Clostridium sp. MCC353 TaxID=2592646 RepID=UPI001C02C1DE|nr:TRAP transporter substrate-binding protein [Clostridium sp. MCC353]MBT9777787.1 DctP family TRAP transporter solute-binding subunit [Clostridium sp. MCC353]